MRKTKVLELLSRNLNVSFFDASFSVLLVLCSAESTEAEGEEEDVETKDASLDRKAAAAELSRPRLENVGQDEDFVDDYMVCFSFSLICAPYSRFESSVLLHID